MIELDQAGARYQNDGPWAVRRVSFEVAAGETLALLGPSGCGKSSTLKMVNGLLPFQEGSVRAEGRSVAEWDLPTLRRRLGYVVQRGGLFPHRSVAENIDAVARLERWDEGRRNERVRSLLAQVELGEEFAARKPAELSGGQAQRVALARALMLDPPALLMDEPFSALDPITKHELHRWFKSFSRQLNKAVLWVTHDARAALRLADRIAVMDAGTIVQLGTPQALRASPSSEWVARVLGADT
ncbi:MAG: ATP-binding cassette domain-containing protein [Myxococcota bacterium]